MKEMAKALGVDGRSLYNQRRRIEAGLRRLTKGLVPEEPKKKRRKGASR
jgi:hypothetical protein